MNRRHPLLLFNRRHHSRKGQVMTFLIVIMAVLLLLTMMLINLGRLASMRTTLTNAVDGATLSYVSAMSRVAREVAATNGYKVNEVCNFDWSSIGKIIEALVVVVVMIITQQWELLAVLGPLIGASASASFLLQRLAVQPHMLENITKSMKNLTPVDQLRESTILSVLAQSVDDPNTEPDIFDLNGNGCNGPTDTSDPNRDCSKDPAVPAFGNWQQQRIQDLQNKRLSGGQIPNLDKLKDMVRDLTVQLRYEVYRMGKLKEFLDEQLPTALNWTLNYPLQQPICGTAITDPQGNAVTPPDEDWLIAYNWLGPTSPQSNYCSWPYVQQWFKFHSCQKDPHGGSRTPPTTYGAQLLQNPYLDPQAQKNGGLPFWSAGTQYPACARSLIKPVRTLASEPGVGQLPTGSTCAAVCPYDYSTTPPRLRTDCPDPINCPDGAQNPDGTPKQCWRQDLCNNSTASSPALVRCASAPNPGTQWADPPYNTVPLTCDQFAPSSDNFYWCGGAVLVGEGTDNKTDELEVMSCDLSEYLSFVNHFLNVSSACSEEADAKLENNDPNHTAAQNPAPDQDIPTACMNARLSLLAGWRDDYQKQWLHVLQMWAQQMYGFMQLNGQVPLGTATGWAALLSQIGLQSELDEEDSGVPCIGIACSTTPITYTGLAAGGGGNGNGLFYTLTKYWGLRGDPAAALPNLPYYQQPDGSSDDAQHEWHPPIEPLRPEQIWCDTSTASLGCNGGTIENAFKLAYEDANGPGSTRGPLETLYYRTANPAMLPLQWAVNNLWFWAVELGADHIEFEPDAVPRTVAMSTDNPIYGWLDGQRALHLVQVDVFNDSSNVHGGYQTAVALPFINYFADFFDNCREVKHATGDVIVTARRYDQDQPISRLWTMQTRQHPEQDDSSALATLAGLTVGGGTNLSSCAGIQGSGCLSSDEALKCCIREQPKPFQDLLDAGGTRACAKGTWSWQNMPDTHPDYGDDNNVTTSPVEKQVDGIGLVKLDFGLDGTSGQKDNLCGPDSPYWHWKGVPGPGNFYGGVYRANGGDRHK